MESPKIDQRTVVSVERKKMLERNRKRSLVTRQMNKKMKMHLKNRECLKLVVEIIEKHLADTEELDESTDKGEPQTPPGGG